jgi:hypothetical protein
MASGAGGVILGMGVLPSLLCSLDARASFFSRHPAR